MNDTQDSDIEVPDDGADQILRIGGILVARLTGLKGQRQVDWQPTAHFDERTNTAFAKAYAQSGQSEAEVRGCPRRRTDRNALGLSHSTDLVQKTAAPPGTLFKALRYSAAE